MTKLKYRGALWEHRLKRDLRREAAKERAKAEKAFARRMYYDFDSIPVGESRDYPNFEMKQISPALTRWRHQPENAAVVIKAKTVWLRLRSDGSLISGVRVSRWT